MPWKLDNEFFSPACGWRYPPFENAASCSLNNRGINVMRFVQTLEVCPICEYSIFFIPAEFFFLYWYYCPILVFFYPIKQEFSDWLHVEDNANQHLTATTLNAVKKQEIISRRPNCATFRHFFASVIFEISASSRKNTCYPNGPWVS